MRKPTARYASISRLAARTIRALAAAAMLAASCVANAANVPKTHSLFVTVMAGQQVFDSNTALADDRYAGAGIGFRFNDRHSLEFVAGRTDTTTTVPSPANIDTRRIDALWHYFRGGALQPYILTGAGQDEYSFAGQEGSGTFANAGGGFFLHVAGPFQLRAEARALYGFEDDVWHGVATLGIACVFGGDYLGAPPQPPTLP